MTDSHSPFLATICDHAESDGPRLVWADYLEDNGDSDRAEFIRGGIELACRCKSLSPPDGTGIRRSELCIACSQGGHNYTQEEIDRGACDPRCGCQWCKLRCRQIDLFRAHGQAWFGDAVGGKVGKKCVNRWGHPHNVGLKCPDCENSGRVVQWPFTVQVPCDRCNDRGESQNPNFRCSLCSGYAATLTIARGFLDVLRSPTLEAFVGEICEGCYDNDEHGFAGHGNWRKSKCPQCHGIGRTPGLARLFAVAPITAVMIDDREPCLNSEWYKAGRERILDSHDLDPESEIPDEIFDLLCGYDDAEPKRWKRYVTAELANLALSQACVKWGRKGVR